MKQNRGIYPFLRFARVFTIVAILQLAACSWLDFSPKSGSEINREKASPHPLLQTFPQNPDLSDVIRISYQADQVVREAWWVLTQEKPGAGRSPFGKIMRAATQKKQGKLASKGLFACDRYETTSPQKRTSSYDFAEACLAAASQSPFAHWEFKGKAEAMVEFYPRQLGDILGMSSEIFAQKISCQLSWNERRVLDEMKCSGWEQDHQDNRIRLSEFLYTREGGQILTLKGVVLSGLEAIRKIESTVPLVGKIVVTEIVTKALEVEEDTPPAQPGPPATATKKQDHRLQPAAVLPPGAVPLNQAPPRFQPKEDPDILRHRQYRFEEEVTDEELNQAVSGQGGENAADEQTQRQQDEQIEEPLADEAVVPMEGGEATPESELAPEVKVRPESAEKKGR